LRGVEREHRASNQERGGNGRKKQTEGAEEAKAGRDSSMLAGGRCARPGCCHWRGYLRDSRDFAGIELQTPGARQRWQRFLSLPLTRFRRNMAGVAIKPPRHPLCQ